MMNSGADWRDPRFEGVAAACPGWLPLMTEIEVVGYGRLVCLERSTAAVCLDGACVMLVLSREPLDFESIFYLVE